MPDPALADAYWVTVKTRLPTVPFPPSDSKPHITTSRLLLRPLVEDDFDTICILHNQPEVMLWSTRGLPDGNVEATRQSFNGYMPPNDAETWQYAICLRDTSEMIGTGGSHCRKGALGWPMFNYMLRKEFWGNGYGTEFLRAFLDLWWSLPRADAQISVSSSTVAGDNDINCEMITADTQFNNFASQNILTKCGLRQVTTFQVQDKSKPGRCVHMHGFAGTEDETRPRSLVE